MLWPAQHASAEKGREPVNGLDTATSSSCPATVCHLVPRHSNFSTRRFWRRSPGSCCVQCSTAMASSGDTEGRATHPNTHSVGAGGEGRTRREGHPGTKRRRALRGCLDGDGALPVTPALQGTPVRHAYPSREGPGTELSASDRAGDQAHREALTEYATTMLRTSPAVPAITWRKLKCTERM